MLYDEPKRLVRLGLATARQEPAGRRTQAVYTITGQGRGARCFAGLKQRDRVLVSPGSAAVGFL